MLDMLKALCALPGVSGSEDAVRDYIIAAAAPHATTTETDVMGNVIVFKKGARPPKKRLMLCAHMDEVGVIITGITDDGYLKFAPVGGIDRRILPGKALRIGGQGVFGVIGCKAVHLQKAEERKKAVKTEDLYIDIGAGTKEDAARLVSLGDTGVFDSAPEEFGDGFLRARAIDDRFGCAVLLALLRDELPYDSHFVFTVQEEVGTRGAFASAFRLEPEVALVIDGTTAADLPGVTGTKRICEAGKGVVIPFMDGGTIYSRRLYTLLTELAQANAIPWQTKSMIAGGTDAMTIQRTRGGVLTAGIAAAVRNIHTPVCVAKIKDMEDALQLARLFLQAAGEL